MTDNEIIKVFNILDKFEFFGGQRAGRELWFDKPTDVQDKDIESFARDVEFLKDFINRQQAEIERLKRDRKGCWEEFKKLIEINKVEVIRAKSETRKEFAEELRSKARKYTEYDEGGWDRDVYAVEVAEIDNLLAEKESESKC